MKHKRYFIAMGLILVGYLSFLFVEKTVHGGNEPPVIEVPEGVLELSVMDDEEALKQDVKAKDPEDGDLTGDIFVENISEFNENQERTVTFTVIDHKNAVTRAYRTITYTDYQEPELFIQSPLVMEYGENMDKTIGCMGATSVVDQDISNRIVIDFYSNDEESPTVTFSVKDSCGTRVTQTCKLTWLNNFPTIQIKLSQYQLAVEQGTEIDPYAYIEEVSENDIPSDDFSDIEIRTDYDPEVPGTYEFIYEKNKVNGNFGFTKLVVIVE